jgi:hypothetical protein
LSRLKRLKKLWIENNRITNKGGLLLSKSLSSDILIVLSMNIIIYLGGNRIDEKHMKKIKVLLPNSY